MTINRNLSFLAEGASATGVLAVTNGGTGVTSSTGTNKTVLSSLPSFDTTIGVGAATASASGSGITFPATQSSSTSVNTLDDYEEGTWTPAYATGFSSITYGARTGTYTKVGRFVQLNLYINAGSGVASGNISISGLPFSTGSYSQNNYIGVVQVQSTSGVLSSGTVLMRVTDGDTTLYLQTQSITGAALMAGSDLGANSIINATIQYIAAT